LRPVIAYPEIDDFGEIEERVSSLSQIHHGTFPSMGQGPWDPLTRILLPQSPKNTSHVDKHLPSLVHSPLPPEFLLARPEGVLSEPLPRHDGPGLDEQLQKLSSVVWIFFCQKSEAVADPNQTYCSRSRVSQPKRRVSTKTIRISARGASHPALMLQTEKVVSRE
jgi:hypothetical protein